MLTENGIEVDLERVHALLRQADVLTIGFTLFPERVLIDTRSNGSEGPLVAVVEPVASVQERYLWLGKHRGDFGMPEGFSFFVWPHTVRSLIERDVIAPLRERMAAEWPEAAVELDRLLEELAQRERRAMLAAVKGEEPWHTLWERRPAA